MENPFDTDFTLPPSPAESRASNAGQTSPAEQGSNIPVGWKPTIAEPVPVIRCTATAKATGEQCRRWSLRGATVCQKHGGYLPSVIDHSNAVVESARLRLMGLADAAVDGLEDLIKEGTSPQIRLGAIKEVLDRAGVKGAPDLTVEITQTVSYKDEIQNRLTEIRNRKTALQKQAEEDIIDAEEIIAVDNDTEGTDGTIS